jgi:CRISPR/Cas system-associated exonuclease Cas4 (RecB family)
MPLPTDFAFSQGSLQDYVDCPRRFQLRYVERVAWPAIEVEPVHENERYLQQGAAFHRLVHQHALGVPAAQLTTAAGKMDLRRWWRNYLEGRPANLPAARHPEIVLSAPLGGYRLLAKYDLVAVDPGQRVVIVDWKTSRKRTPRRWLEERLQTKVYLYLVVQAGAHLNGGRALAPQQVTMIYWFADFPADPEHFVYDAARHETDAAYLTALVEEIAGLADDLFPLTANERRCCYCPYRSLCQRGVAAGQFDPASDEASDEIESDLELGDGLDISLDLEQIAEIEY